MDGGSCVPGLILNCYAAKDDLERVNLLWLYNYRHGPNYLVYVVLDLMWKCPPTFAKAWQCPCETRCTTTEPHAQTCSVPEIPPCRDVI